MWNLKYDTKRKQTHRHRKQTQGYKRGEWGGGRDKLGAWDWQMQAIVYKIDKLQGPNVWHREIYSISCNKL